jgi:hypothetical protein
MHMQGLLTNKKYSKYVETYPIHMSYLFLAPKRDQVYISLFLCHLQSYWNILRSHIQQWYYYNIFGDVAS